MNFNKKLWMAVTVVVVAIIVIVFIMIILRQNVTSTKLELTVTADRFVYKVGEPILIRGQIKNVSGQELYFYAAESSLATKFEILDPQGKEIEAAYPINDPPLPELKEFTLLRPGDALQKDFEVFMPEEKIKVSGIYSISVIYDVPQDWYFDDHKYVKLNAWTGTLKSNAIKVEIGTNEQKANIDTEQKCRSFRGQWRGAICVLPASDVGKECRNSGECQADCIADLTQEEKKLLSEGPGKHSFEKVGHCSEFVFGCYARVNSGKVDGILCAD